MRRDTRSHKLAAWLVAGLSILLMSILIASHVVGVSAAPISSAGRTNESTTPGLAPWLYMPSGFGGKVLHWSDRLYYFEATIVDPSNGKILLGDHWMALDADGQPTAYFERYTYLNGQLHQEIYQDRTISVDVRGADYLRPHELVPPGWCVTSMQTSLSDLVGNYPLFANAAKLGRTMNMKDTGTRAQTLAPPTTSSLPGIMPTAQLGNVTTVDVWVSAQVDPADGSKGTRGRFITPNLPRRGQEPCGESG